VKKRLLARYINVHESGTHHSRWVVLSILLVLMTQFLILWGLLSNTLTLLIPAGALLASALVCHYSFLSRCKSDLKRNVTLSFAVLCIYDMAVLGWGIVQGSVQYMFGKKY